MTGRYILDDDSEFMNVLKTIDDINYDCIIKYGSYDGTHDNNFNENSEYKWTAVTRLIEHTKIYKLNKLGIYVCPGSNTYYPV
jgi:hypothetical protein